MLKIGTENKYETPYKGPYNSKFLGITFEKHPDDGSISMT
jgi:hypothetical protein